jgi:hypothetical protein
MIAQCIDGLLIKHRNFSMMQLQMPVTRGDVMAWLRQHSFILHASSVAHDADGLPDTWRFYLYNISRQIFLFFYCPFSLVHSFLFLNFFLFFGFEYSEEDRQCYSELPMPIYRVGGSGSECLSNVMDGSDGSGEIAKFGGDGGHDSDFNQPMMSYWVAVNQFNVRKLSKRFGVPIPGADVHPDSF